MFWQTKKNPQTKKRNNVLSQDLSLHKWHLSVNYQKGDGGEGRNHKKAHFSGCITYKKTVLVEGRNTQRCSFPLITRGKTWQAGSMGKV